MKFQIFDRKKNRQQQEAELKKAHQSMAQTHREAERTINALNEKLSNGFALRIYYAKGGKLKNASH